MGQFVQSNVCPWKIPDDRISCPENKIVMRQTSIWSFYGK